MTSNEVVTNLPSLATALTTAAAGQLLTTACRAREKEVSPTPTSSPKVETAKVDSVEKVITELPAIRRGLGENPQLPVPSEWTREIKMKGGSREVVIDPEKFRLHYGIQFLVREPVTYPSGESRLEPTSGMEVFIRTHNPQLLQEVFGFLWPDLSSYTPDTDQPYLLRALDIIIVKNSHLCSPKFPELETAFTRDYASWFWETLGRFIKTLKRYQPEWEKAGIPRVTLPNAETVPKSSRPGLSQPFLDFGGQDIEGMTSQLTIFRDAFNPAPPGKSLTPVRATCAVYEVGGLAGGPLPEFITDAGKLVTDRNGKPLLRLRSRVYCAIDPEKIADIVTTGGVLVHEISHQESRFRQQRLDRENRSDRHVIDTKHGTATLTIRSQAYLSRALARLAQGDNSGLLFFIRTKNEDALGFSGEEFHPRWLLPAAVHPGGFLLGMASLGASKFFADRMVGPDGTPNGRAWFLATGLGSWGAVQLRLFNNLFSPPPSSEIAERVALG